MIKIKMVPILAMSVFVCCCHMSKQISTLPNDCETVHNAFNKVSAKLTFERRPSDKVTAFYVWPHNSVYLGSYYYGLWNDTNKCSLELYSRGSSQEVADHLGKALYSFLNQEIDPSYVNEHDLIKPEIKSKNEMVKRTFLNMGYGIAYVGKDNPFVTPWDNKLGVYFFGAMDISLIGLAVGGPFIGKTDRNRLSISLTAISGLLAFKFIVLFAQNIDDLNAYNIFVNSGYLWPKMK